MKKIRDKFSWKNVLVSFICLIVIFGLIGTLDACYDPVTPKPQSEDLVLTTVTLDYVNTSKDLDDTFNGETELIITTQITQKGGPGDKARNCRRYSQGTVRYIQFNDDTTKGVPDDPQDLRAGSGGKFLINEIIFAHIECYPPADIKYCVNVFEEDTVNVDAIKEILTSTGAVINIVTGTNKWSGAVIGPLISGVAAVLGSSGDNLGTVMRESKFFSIDSDPGLESELNKKRIPERLKNEFKKEGINFSEEPILSKEGNKWEIYSGAEVIYVIKKENKMLNIYSTSIQPVIAKPHPETVSNDEYQFKLTVSSVVLPAAYKCDDINKTYNDLESLDNGKYKNQYKHLKRMGTYSSCCVRQIAEAKDAIGDITSEVDKDGNQCLTDEQIESLKTYLTNIIEPQKVLIGQDLQFDDFSAPPTVYKVEDGNIEAMYEVGDDYRIDNVNWEPGRYYVNYRTETDYDAQLAVQEVYMPIHIEVGDDWVTSIAVGTPITIDTGGMNLFTDFVVDLVVIGPDGQIKYDAINDQQFTGITVDYLRSHYGNNNLKTTGWPIGVYTFQIETKPEYACGLEAESTVKELSVVKDEIDIDADKTSVAELERIKLTVTGVAGHYISITTSDAEHTTFPAGVNNNKPVVDGVMNDTIDADGVRTYVVEFDDTKSYTITAEDYGTDPTRKKLVDDDDVDITVSEKDVTFDMPTTVVIGEKLAIKGHANTGDWIQVAVDDTICDRLTKLVIDENGEFEKEIDTSKACKNEFAVPGSLRLKAFIDGDYSEWEDVSKQTDDGSIAL
ncbi:MAG: hypothetical protein KAX30_07370, partial [Candidatus Atribacteria bacterium]|nr:hypothetical protein [Candidatus Atribacteria bacterium]